MRATDEQIERVKHCVSLFHGDAEALAAVLAELATLRAENTQLLSRPWKVGVLEAKDAELSTLRELLGAVTKFGSDCHYSMGEASGAWNRIVKPVLDKCSK